MATTFVPAIPKMPLCTYLFGDLFDLRVDDDTTQNIRSSSSNSSNKQQREQQKR